MISGKTISCGQIFFMQMTKTSWLYSKTSLSFQLPLLPSPFPPLGRGDDSLLPPSYSPDRIRPIKEFLFGPITIRLFQIRRRRHSRNSVQIDAAHHPFPETAHFVVMICLPALIEFIHSMICLVTRTR